MATTLLSQELSPLLCRHATFILENVRCFSAGVVLSKNIRSGCPKITRNRSKPLTYEVAQGPSKIGVTKTWNSWNTSNLKDEEEKTSEITVEDMFIRNFVNGTWANLFVSEIIIKRRMNMVVIAGIVKGNVMPRKIYFLTGYTEELLSYLIKRPVKVEIQTVENQKDMIFKYI